MVHYASSGGRVYNEPFYGPYSATERGKQVLISSMAYKAAESEVQNQL